MSSVGGGAPRSSVGRFFVSSAERTGSNGGTGERERTPSKKKAYVKTAPVEGRAVSMPRRFFVTSVASGEGCVVKKKGGKKYGLSKPEPTIHEEDHACEDTGSGGQTVVKGAQQQGGYGTKQTTKRDDAGWSSADEAPMASAGGGHRPRSVQNRQRRRSGEDPAPPPRKTTPAPPSPGGLLDTFRPRSKSDAARLINKRPNLMTNIRNAVQHSLVSPGGSAGRSGRRSGDSTPPIDTQRSGEYQHHNTWHGREKPKPAYSIAKFMEIFRHRDPEAKKRNSLSGKGDRSRRNSGEERSKSSTGSLTSVYIRGVDPVGAAAVFRDSRGLPQADSLKYCFDQEEESQILVKFFKLHRSYDLIPTSAKLVIFDTSLQVKKAFYALVHNGVRAAPLWDHERQRFVGMLTITDFIRILHSFHHNRDPQMEVLEEHRLHMWRTFLKDENRPLVSISPDESLFDAIRTLCLHKIHRLPVVDPSTGNVLYIITHKRILKFLYLYINELPKPLVLQKTVGELELGTYTNIETATPQTLIIEALDKFVKHRISALPIVDEEGKLLDIYAKFDVINLAAGGTYNKLDVTLAEANEYRNEWFEGVLHCNRSEKLCTIMDRIVRAEVHRLVVVDDDKKVIGVVSLSDILNELVLKPSELSEKLASPLASPITDLEGGVEGGNATPAPPTNELTHEPPQTGTSPPVVPPFPCLDPLSLGDSEDEGQYSMEKSE